MLDRTSLEPAAVGWLGPELPPARRRAVDSALQLLGGRLETTSRGEDCRALIGTFEGLETISANAMKALRARPADVPVLLFPGRAGYAPSEKTLAALRLLAADETLSFQEVGSETAYRFADVPLVRPFDGQVLHESEPRLLSSLVPSRAATPLTTGAHGSIFARFDTGLFLSTVPQLEPNGGRLKDEFRSSRFLGLLPLLLFIREALGSSAWTSVSPRAAFMIDDPNLRVAHYGFMGYHDLIAAAKTHGFHTAFAMIPIDWKKTSGRVAGLLRENRDHVSIVMHGVDHVSEEFAGAASLREAESKVAQGLARMSAHERETGVEFARAITFPHGICSTTWLRALRNAGLEAAVAEWARPIDLDPTDDPLYEMRPAELSFLAFPMINRFPAEQPPEELLFKAFLGKPLIVYSHHRYFRDGLEALVHLAEFLNDRLAPRWSSIGEIVRSNYQVREGRSGVAVRVFSNHVHAELVGKEFDAVVKPSVQLPADEVCRVNGTSVAATVLPAVGTAFAASPSSRLEITFAPRHPTVVPVAPGRPSLKSRTRRLATELRDQVVHPLLRLALAIVA